MAAGVDHFGFVNGLDAGDCRGFVGRYGRSGELRNGERRDDQDDRYHDQKLDKGESPLSVTSAHTTSSLVSLSVLSGPPQI